MSDADLNTLSQFVVVARHLNFRRAAAELAVAPSTLSERIRDLEGQLGVRLLNRTTRSCALTDEGKRLLDRIAPAIAVLEDAAASSGGADQMLAGTLRINGPRPAIDLRLMPLLRGFLNEHPGIRVELVAQSELVDVVAAGFDAGLRYDETLAADVIAVRLGPDQRMVIAGSPAYFTERGRPKSPKDLTHHDCIAHRFARGNLLTWSLTRRKKEVAYTPRGRFVTNGLEAAIEAARASLGLIYTFDDYIAEDIANGTLETVLDDWTPPFAGPKLYYPERRLMPPALRAFVDYIQRS